MTLNQDLKDSILQNNLNHQRLSGVNEFNQETDQTKNKLIGMIPKEYEMHRHGDYGVFYSMNHQSLLKQIIGLLGYKYLYTNVLFCSVEFETLKVDIDDVDTLCHKLDLLGWQRC